MASRRWKLDVYARGVTSTTGTISYTLGSSYFRVPPVVGGQIVRAAECQVESNPWRCSIIDVGSTFTAKLADSSGRLHLLGRLARLRASLNSTATSNFSSVTVGRITDIALAPDVASYDLDISDERWIERQTTIFSKVTSFSIVPYGNVANFQGVPPVQQVRWRCIQKTGNLVCLRYDGAPPIPTNPSIIQLIVDDVKLGAIPGNTSVAAGNFRTLRFKNTTTATDYEIAAFGEVGLPLARRPNYPTASLLGWWTDPALGTDGTRDTPQEKLYVWLVWTASTPSLDTDVIGYLYAPTHEPTENLPQLIGGSTGLHPFTLVKQIYQGTHSATTSLTVRFSTAAFDRLEDDPSMGRVWYRATAAEGMADFLDSRVYGPYNVAPVVDSSGKVAPQRMWLPTSTQLNVAGLAAITSTNIIGAHPTWEHPSGEIVNAIRYSYPQYVNTFRWFPGDSLSFLPRPTTLTVLNTWDTLTYFGRRELTFRALNVPGLNVQFSTGGYPVWGQAIFGRLAQGIFHRYGDGPVYSELQCTSSVDATTNGALLPGAFVKVRLATFPNAGVAARGSTRVMQIVRRDVTPLGRGFRLLDVGSNLNPLSAPTLTLALSSQSSRHTLKGTVASLTAGSRYEAQLAASSSTGAASPPASSSPRWFTAAVGSSTGLVWRSGPHASKRKYFGRVRASKSNRIGSAWSTANVSAVTASIGAPSALTAGTLTAGTAILKWTNGSSMYGTEVLVDATSTATLTSTNYVGWTPPQTTRFSLIGLNSNDGHKAAVWHKDDWGGRSAQATVTFTTTTSFTAAPSLKGLVIVSAK